MRASPPAVAVAALVLIAGCPTTVDDGTPGGTVTPAPVPTTAIQYPPGVTENSVSGSELAAAHERALERTNYTLVIRQRIVGPNATIQRLNGTRRVLAGGETYVGRYNRSISGFPLRRSAGTVEYWTDGGGYAVRQRERGREAYLTWFDTGEPLVDVDGSRSLNLTVGALRFAVTTPDNGTVALVVTGLRDPEALPTPAYIHNTHDITGTFRVRADGLVIGWRIAYDANLGERSVRVVREAHIRDLGSTTVERPGWVDEARNRSGS